MASTGAWLDPSELRIGLGCMRLSTDPDRDEERATATIAAAADAGITVFDTARAYGHGADDLGHNERLLARALRACGAAERARVVTKGGMARPGGAWVPDGRANAIRADCEASLEALAGMAVDLYLLHAPDPRTPWRTSLRALQRLLEAGAVRRIGVANVTRAQLDEAIAVADVSAVSVALGPHDDRALRGGVVERCAQAGLAVIAHAPLGGPARAARLGRSDPLASVAAATGAAPAEVALAAVIGLSPGIVAVPGARRPETARSAARAAGVALPPRDRAGLARAFGWTTSARPRRRPVRDGEVVLVMGIPGAGKSRLAAAHADRGYLRLNRDQRGGSLRGLADALAAALAAGADRVVLDNTYLTRAERSRVVDAAAAHGAAARCVWLDTPLAQAQVNVVGRLLDRFGRLPDAGELRAAARREPGLLAPAAQMRALRALEPPADDEGFVEVRRVAFVREPADGSAGAFVAAPVTGRPGWEAAVTAAGAGAPCLVFDWLPEGGGSVEAAAGRVAAVATGPVEAAACPHPGGPPRCWCRPPLPGLPLAFARAHGVDPARSVLVGTRPAHRALAAALGARAVLL